MEYGNSDFNNGLKKSIYAYHIHKIYMLEKPIDLKLKEYLFNMKLREEI